MLVEESAPGVLTGVDDGRVTLEHAVANLSVRANEPGAQVYVDGERGRVVVLASRT